MNSHKLIVVCISIVLSFELYAQSNDDFPGIDEKLLPGLEVISGKTYTGSSLYGYINGGAELYKEYGFSAARITEINYEDKGYTVEIYRMGSREAAFGIFSVSRFNCTENPPVADFTCQTPWQLQICKGLFYINIINSRGKSEDYSNSLLIGKALADIITDRSADLSGFFPGLEIKEINKEAILVKGELGVMNGVSGLSDFFSDATGYTALIVQDENTYRVSIKFPTEESFTSFCKMHNWEVSGLSTDTVKMPDGTEVSRIGDRHLLLKVVQR